MVVPAAPDGSAVTGGGRTRSPRFRLVLLVVLVLVALGSGAWLAATVVGRTGGTVSQPQRDEVMSVARQFMLAINTYGPDQVDDQGQMPQYRQDVTALITPKFQASFDQSVTIAEQTAKAGLTRKADVFATGVSSLDQDSATVLVAGSFTNTYAGKGGKQVSDEPAPFRVAVQVVRIGGKWLVDDFAPVTGVDDGSGSSLPSAPASPAAPQPGAPTSSGGAR